MDQSSSALRILEKSKREKEFRHLFLGKYVPGSYTTQYYPLTGREETPKVRQAVRTWEQRTGQKIETLYEK